MAMHTSLVFANQMMSVSVCIRPITYVHLSDQVVLPFQYVLENRLNVQKLKRRLPVVVGRSLRELR